NVAGMAGLLVEAAGGVAVKDRPAKGGVHLGMAVRANGHVPAGHDELKLVAARRAEDGDVLLRAPGLAVGVVLELLQELGVPFRVDDVPENIVNDGLLLFGVEIAADLVGRNVPVVRHVRPQQAALGVLVVPVKADFSFLIVRQLVEEDFYRGFGRAAPGGGGLDPRRCEKRQTAGRGCCRHAHGLEKSSAIEADFTFAIRTRALLCCHSRLLVKTPGYRAAATVQAITAGEGMPARKLKQPQWGRSSSRYQSGESEFSNSL